MSGIDQYVFQVTQNLVDDVCLFYAKQDAIKGRYQQQLISLVAGSPSQTAAEDQIASEKETEGDSTRMGTMAVD